MADGTTLIVPLEPEVEAQLAQLAERTRRSRSSLAAEAIALHVARESGIVDAIRRGFVDVSERRLVPHEEAMAELDAAIDEGTRAI